MSASEDFEAMDDWPFAVALRAILLEACVFGAVLGESDADRKVRLAQNAGAFTCWTALR